MKSTFLMFAIWAGVDAATHFTTFQEEWNQFKVRYNKVYETDDEEHRRMRIFLDNKREINEHNLMYQTGEVTYEMGINQFADMTPEEVDDLYNCYNKVGETDEVEDSSKNKLKSELFIPSFAEIPKEINWVTQGAVTPVKDQLKCGSCYAFAGVAALEGHYFIKNKKLIPLSVQNVVDCSQSQGNDGCSGGLTLRTYDYIAENGGINSESSYPYEGREGKCRYDRDNVAATISGYIRLRSEEKQVLAALALGPVSISVDASRPSFHKYDKGIYDDPGCSTEKLNHAMLLVGYGTDKSTNENYWLVKNSWDTTWGEDGYVRLARNGNNTCGILTRASFPVL